MTSRFTTIGLKVAIVAIIIQPAWAGEATMRKVAYAGWPNCVELTNGKVKLVATTDVGPRIMHFGFVDGQNVFKHYKDMRPNTSLARTTTTTSRFSTRGMAAHCASCSRRSRPQASKSTSR